MATLRALQNFLSVIEKWLIVALLSVMVLLSFFQVVLRQGFQTGLLWGDVFLRHLVLWVGFLGAGVAAAQDKHFVIDATQKLFRGRWKHLAAFLAETFTLFCLYFLSGAALRFFQDDRTSGSVLFTVAGLEVPSFWMNAAIPGFFLLLAVHFFLRAAENLMQFVSPNKDEE